MSKKRFLDIPQDIKSPTDRVRLGDTVGKTVPFILMPCYIQECGTSGGGEEEDKGEDYCLHQA